MNTKEIKVAYGIDIDAVGGWLGLYGGDSPDDISRGLFAGEVGVPRLLQLVAKDQIKASWFIAGHSSETLPLPWVDSRLRGATSNQDAAIPA